MSSASVNPRVLIVNGGYHEDASLGAQHSSGQGGVRGHDVSLQTPGDGERMISFRNHASKLGEFSLIDNIFPKGEWNDLRLLCK